MKKLLFLSVFAALIITSCKEIMPTIPPLSNKGAVIVDPTVDNRKILIEEFTGVRCVNCPAGSREIENLLRSFPDNLIAISIHAGFFSPPYNESLYDFQTDDGNNFVGTYLGGEPFAYPSATVNREKTNNGSFYTTLSEWAGLITNEIAEDIQVTLEMDRTYNEASRDLDVEVTVNPKTSIPNDLRITLIITENNIVDYQLLPDPDGKIADYKHKHVLREIVTPVDGEIVSDQELVAGMSIDKSFSFTLPDDWVAENCAVVAVVHRNTPDSKEVLNAEEVHVIE